MKKFAFAVLIAVVAASPAMAAKKAKKAAPAQPTVAELNDPGFRFIRDSLPIYYPTIVKAGMYPVGNKSK